VPSAYMRSFQNVEGTSKIKCCDNLDHTSDEHRSLEPAWNNNYGHTQRTSSEYNRSEKINLVSGTNVRTRRIYAGNLQTLSECW
jgi:hypothetical protein